MKTRHVSILECPDDKLTQSRFRDDVHQAQTGNAMTGARRVLLLTHRDLVPPDDPTGLTADERLQIQTELDVLAGLTANGHEVIKVGVFDDLGVLRDAIDEHRPHAVFNLLEEFRERVVYDAHVVGYLELLGIPYTGCNP